MQRECEGWGERLFEPEDALSENERLGLSEHLAKCEECSTERALFLESWSALDDFEEDLEPSPLLRAEVWERIRQGECSAPEPFLERWTDDHATPWQKHSLRLAAAAAAVFLGFGLGRSLRSSPTGLSAPAIADAQAGGVSPDFLDPAMIQLASQEGFSMELFPEATHFSPIDREMMSALAPTDESRQWLQVDRGVVVPLRYISQGVPRKTGSAP